MKKYKNKIFDKIDYKNSVIESLLFKLLPDKREKRWSKQRALFGGFDERCTWSLCWFMTEHIYIWLKMYFKFADKNIKLDFHKFTINGVERSQRDWILKALKDLEYYLKHGDGEKENKAFEKAANAYSIIGIILPVLWW